MGTVVTPTVDTCDELWYDPDEFQAKHSDLEDAEAEAIVREATYALWLLTYQRFHGIQCLEEVYVVRAEQRVLKLDKWPVSAVQNVWSTDVTGTDSDAFADWSERGDGDIMLTPPSLTTYGWTGCSSNARAYLKVAYSISSNVPIGMDRVTLRLADEYYKFHTGAKNCALPEATSVSRQGMSWTIYNPDAFLERGMTGITMIDQFVGLQNRMKPLSVKNPLFTGRLLSSTITGCGEGCEA